MLNVSYFLQWEPEIRIQIYSNSGLKFHHHICIMITNFKWHSTRHVRYPEACMSIICIFTSQGAYKRNDIPLSCKWWICSARRYDKSLDLRLDSCIKHSWCMRDMYGERKHFSLDISPRRERDESVPLMPKVKCLKYRSSSKDIETEIWDSSRAEHSIKAPSTDWSEKVENAQMFSVHTRQEKFECILKCFQNVFRPH